MLRLVPLGGRRPSIGPDEVIIKEGLDDVRYLLGTIVWRVDRDVLTLSGALADGFEIGVVVTSRRARPGDHQNNSPRPTGRPNRTRQHGTLDNNLHGPGNQLHKSRLGTLRFEITDRPS